MAAVWPAKEIWLLALRGGASVLNGILAALALRAFPDLDAIARLSPIFILFVAIALLTDSNLREMLHGHVVLDWVNRRYDALRAEISQAPKGIAALRAVNSGDPVALTGHVALALNSVFAILAVLAGLAILSRAAFILHLLAVAVIAAILFVAWLEKGFAARLSAWPHLLPSLALVTTILQVFLLPALLPGTSTEILAGCAILSLAMALPITRIADLPESFALLRDLHQLPQGGDDTETQPPPPPLGFSVDGQSFGAGDCLVIHCRTAVQQRQIMRGFSGSEPLPSHVAQDLGAQDSAMDVARIAQQTAPVFADPMPFVPPITASAAPIALGPLAHALELPEDILTWPGGFLHLEDAVPGPGLLGAICDPRPVILAEMPKRFFGPTEAVKRRALLAAAAKSGKVLICVTHGAAPPEPKGAKFLLIDLTQKAAQP